MTRLTLAITALLALPTSAMAHGDHLAMPHLHAGDLAGYALTALGALALGYAIFRTARQR